MLGWGGGVWKSWWERKETQPWLPALSFHACNFGWGVGALPFCWDQTDSCFFLRRPRRMGPRPPKPMILSAIGSQAEGTKSPSSSEQPFTHSPGMQLQGQSPVSSLFLPNFFPCCHEREKPFPPPSLPHMPQELAPEGNLEPGKISLGQKQEDTREWTSDH